MSNGSSRPFISFDKRHHSFSLVELLTAIAVFSLLLILLVQSLDGILQATNTQNQQMDSVAAARRAIDVMNVDLQNAVVSENAAVLAPDGVSTNIIALLATRRGPSGTTGQRYLAVSYCTNANDQLIRSYGSVDFTQTNLLASAAAIPIAPVEPLAKNILAIETQALADGTNSYLLSDPAVASWATNNYNGITPPSGYKALITRSPAFAASFTNRTHALQLWIAVVDNADYTLLKNTGELTALKASLGNDPTLWRSTIDSASIPSRAKSGIRILNRTVPLR